MVVAYIFGVAGRFSSQVFIMPKLTTWLQGLDTTIIGSLLGHVPQTDFGAAGQSFGEVPGQSTHRFPHRLPISIPLKRTLIPAYDNYYQGNDG